MAVLLTKKPNNITEYPNAFKRQGAFPLEADSIFQTLADAKRYAQEDPVAYVGQVIAVASSNKDDEGKLIQTTTLYIIGNTDGDLIELGTFADIEALDLRLQKVEEFFAELDGKSFDEALDTLIEAQERINLIYDDKDAEGKASGLLVDEINRATAAENGLAEDLKSEKSRAESAEKELLDALGLTQQAVEENKQAIEAENTRARTAEAFVSEKVDNEATRAILAEKQLLNSLIAEEQRAQEAEELIREDLKNNFDEINSLLEKEINRAEKAEEKETLARIAADNVVYDADGAKDSENNIIATGLLPDEIARAKQAEKNLADNFNKALKTEAVTREAADNVVYDADGAKDDEGNQIATGLLPNEVARAVAAETTLNNKIDQLIEQEQLARETADNVVYDADGTEDINGNPVATGLLIDEIARAKQAETDLSTKIDEHYTTWTWTDGAKEGPTAAITGKATIKVGPIPAANGDKSGIVTTEKQTFAGDKTFLGTVVVENLTVNGTTTSTDFETAVTKENLIVTNSEGNSVEGKLSGLAIRVNKQEENNAYGIVYNNFNNEEVIQLGIGTVNEGNGYEFEFKDGQNETIATREYVTSEIEKLDYTYDTKDESAQNTYFVKTVTQADGKISLTREALPKLGFSSTSTTAATLGNGETITTLVGAECIADSTGVDNGHNIRLTTKAFTLPEIKVATNKNLSLDDTTTNGVITISHTGAESTSSTVSNTVQAAATTATQLKDTDSIKLAKTEYDENGHKRGSSLTEYKMPKLTTWIWASTATQVTATLGGDGITTLSIPDVPLASTNQSGVVSAATQSFAGDKTFTGTVSIEADKFSYTGAKVTFSGIVDTEIATTATSAYVLTKIGDINNNQDTQINNLSSTYQYTEVPTKKYVDDQVRELNNEFGAYMNALHNLIGGSLDE